MACVNTNSSTFVTNKLLPLLLAAIARMALVFWVGGLWVIGYLVVPLLFASLDNRALAGVLAGQFFAAIAWLGLAAAALLLLMQFRDHSGGRQLRRYRLALLWVMGGLAALQLFYLQPEMAALKQAAAPVDVMGSTGRAHFVFWHALSSSLYLLQSILGACLVLWPEKWPR